MKAFVSWSSGKDCMYALYKFIQQKDNEVIALLNMTNAGSDKSRSHGITNEMILRQAAQLSFPLVQQPAGKSDYEANFKKAIETLKNKGVEAGVFGDIYLEEHRVWIERVCSEMEITPVFPLWGSDTTQLIRQFVDDGFKTITVAVRKNKLSQDFLGKVIDLDFIAKLSAMDDIDLCAERGEYHSFVFDGPIFKQPINFTTEEISEDTNHYYIQLI